MTLVSSGADITTTLQDMAPYVRRMMTELTTRKRYADLPILVELIDLMRRWGVDPDPDNSHCFMAAFLAGGPEITTEQAILLRHEARASVLDLRGLEISDESLDLIPGDVTRLALTDAPITDEGLERLIRLRGLSRLNLAGTQITDRGLQELRSLPNLQWVCVCRTLVTPAAVQDLIRDSPSLEIWLDREP